MANTTFTTTQLDFENIKNNLKIFLAQQPELADYNFEGSVLDNILDVLAYNTHYNALLANFALNESYLISAQLRSSIISIAQSMGYSIRSRTASTAYLNLSLDLSAEGSPPSSVILPAGSKFSTSIDNNTYTFQTLYPYTAVDDGSGVYVFQTSEGSESIPVREGTIRTRRFVVSSSSEDNVYVITDDTIDTTTLSVKVYDSYISSNYTEYTSVLGQTSINSQSTFYRVYELPNGYYELNFGDGNVYGQKPTTGNIIVVEYLSCTGEDANGAEIFTPLSDLEVGGTDYPISVTLATRSAGGAARQSNESIRRNAPLVWASQQRLVTPDDYVGTILNRYSTIVDAAAWGGEDHTPAEYGKVFVSLQFDDDVSLSTQEEIKTEIQNILNENMAVMSIDIEFVDPYDIYLVLDTTVYYNGESTAKAPSSLSREIGSRISSYFNTNFGLFGKVFRKSNLLTVLDEYEDYIRSSQIDLKMSLPFAPSSPQITKDYNFIFPESLASPDDDEHAITSSTFYYNGAIGKIVNKFSSTILQVVDLEGNVLVDSIGTYSPSSGTATLNAFAPDSSTSADGYIKLFGKPANQSVIRPKRNMIIDYDDASSTVTVVDDRA